VLFAASVLAADVAAGLAARLDAGLNWDLVDLAREDGKLVGKRPAFSDSVYVDVGWTSEPRLALVRSGSFDPVARGGSAEVEEFDAEIQDFSLAATMVEQAHEEREGPSIEDADIVVAGGRGLGEPEGFKLVEDLAKALGGAVGATRAVVDAAIESGISLIDTADIYGGAGDSEAFIGDALDGRREQVVLATKFGGDMHGKNGPDWGARGSRRYIRIAVESSLRRLRTDWIDLYQYHFPDGVTPIEETLAALDDLVQEGKVRYVGSSNSDASQVAEAEHVARRYGRSRFIRAQNHYSLLERDVEAELAPACERYEIGILPYFPLAHGLLTGKYKRGEPPPPGARLEGRPERLTDEAFDQIEALERFGRERGRSLLEVAISGLAAKPAVGSVIAGATSPEQVRANAEAGDWELREDDLAALDNLLASGS